MEVEIVEQSNNEIEKTSVKEVIPLQWSRLKKAVKPIIIYLNSSG